MEYALSAPPGDGVSSLSFSPVVGSLDLLVGSWDTTVRLYDAARNSCKLTCTLGGACLGSCFGVDGALAFAGGLDQGVYSLDLHRGGAKTVLGGHSKAVSCMQYNSLCQLLFTGGWDCMVNAWDERSSKGTGSFETLGGKVFSLTTQGSLVVAATSNKQILVYDTRNLAEPLQVRDSPLRNQIRKVALSPLATAQNDFFVLASTEARVAVEHVNQAGAKNYAFKCHRKGNVAYPINAIAFHPVHGTFATGGCDGVVFVWDAAQKKKVSQVASYNNSIASLAFSADGSRLAIAASYTHEEGESPSQLGGGAREENVFIRTLDDAEVQAKK